MKTNLIINSEERHRILSLHEEIKEKSKKVVLEQTATNPSLKNRAELLKFFETARTNGCLTDNTLDYNSVFHIVGQTRAYIKGPSKSQQGMVKRIYDDFTWEVVDPKTGNALKNGKWTCDVLQKKPEPPKPEPPKLNSNQLKVLELLKPKGWFHEPAPTDVEVEQKLFDKMNIADASTELGTLYSKYFTDYAPKGFFVYKKNVRQPSEVITKNETKPPTVESCKAAIENLLNSLESPNNYPLTPEEIAQNKAMAEKCAEPANAEKFLLRFGLKNKLKKLVNASDARYRVVSRL